MRYDVSVKLWLRSHLDLVDGVVAALLTVASVAGLAYRDYYGAVFREPNVWAVVLAVLSTAPLAVRRRYPVTVSVVAIGAFMTLSFLDFSAIAGASAALLMIYTVGVHSTVVAGLLVTLATLGGTLAWAAVKRDMFSAVDIDLDPFTIGSQVVIHVGVWSLARTVRARRLYVGDLEDRAARLERTASAEVRAALAEERARMARELHDVVAHHVSVMTVQAAAARRMLPRAPERSVEAMQAVEETGRAALDEMRRIVGALRSVDPGDTQSAGQLSPQAGVAELAPLLDRAREAGLEVELTVVGEPRPLPSSLDLAIYRVVQESLTNTLKHAGPTRAAVLLRYEPEAVVVGVTDDGNRKRSMVTARAVVSDRLGHGLVGMRERVTLNGGTLRTGSRAVGGFEVLATLPLNGAVS
ncbi:sensor histidine kinase [Actinopolymorpha pittospori]